MIKLKYLLFALFFTFNPLKSEYLLFKKSKNSKIKPLKLKKYKKCIKIINKYQFPLSMNFFKKSIPVNRKNEIHNIDDLKELTGGINGDISQILDNEQKFIENEIQKFHPKVKIFFIPKTLYELIFIEKFTRDLILSKYEYSYLKNKLSKLIKKINNDEKLFFKEIVPTIERYKLSFRIDIFNEIFELNKIFKDYLHILKNHKMNQQYKIYLRFKINNLIINDKKNNPILTNFDNSLEKTVNKLNNLKKLVKKQKRKIKKNLSTDFYTFAREIIFRNKFINQKFKKILENALYEEILAHENGNFVIYRGTNGYQECLDKIINQNKNSHYSFKNWKSYGNSIFAGCFNDYQGEIPACTWKFFQCCDYGYALRINIKKYISSKFFDKRKLNYKINIPELDIIDGLVGSGENFHTIIYKNKKAKSHNDESIVEKKFQKYLYLNSKILKNDKSIEKTSEFSINI